jgi:hypothetical protein
VTLSGVPVHPALVHFPVAFWILVPLLDLGNRLDRECCLEAQRMLGHPFVQKLRSVLADFPVTPLEYWTALFVEEGAPDL